MLDAIPRQLQLETHRRCNFSCLMCPRGEPRGVMPTDLIESAIDQAYVMGVRSLHPFMDGEPLLDPRMQDIIIETKTKYSDMEIAIFSNGSLLTEDFLWLCLPCISAFVFSVAGGNKKDYERNAGFSWDIMLKKWQLLLRVNAELGKPTKIISNMCLFSGTKDSLSEYLTTFKDADVVGVANFNNYAGAIRDEFGEAPNKDKPYQLCRRAISHIYIAWNGDVISCCLDSRRELVFGNVKEQSLKNIWYGEKMLEFRRKHRKGLYYEIPLCKACNSNRFNG